MCVNKLSVNVKKSKCMLFSNKSSNLTLSLELNTEILKSVKTYKFLGMILDCQLKFDVHIDTLCAKSRRKIGLLGRVRKYIKKRLLCYYIKLYYYQRLSMAI